VRLTAKLSALTIGFAVVALLGGAPGASAAAYKPVWLCRPGLAKNPCITSLETGIFSPAGTLESTFTPPANPNPPVDCFYIYPTVSAEQTLLSDLRIQPAETDVAGYQAAYYGNVCKIYAPMYHQVTSLAGGVANQNPALFTPAVDAEQYDSVLDAWKYFLAHYSHGRPFVLIGHSQGAFVLRKLISEQIDPNAKLRSRMLSAILFGGAVVVKTGTLVGGSFKNIPGCTSTTELGCVVSWSSYPGPPPPRAVFGDTIWSPTDVLRAVPPGDAILCTNPAALGGGAGTLEPVFPVSFPAGNGVWLPSAEVPGKAGATAWFEYDDSYSAQCMQSNGNNFLEVTPLNGAMPFMSTGTLSPLWGLHPLDANLALGNIVSLIASETTAYLAQSASR
jgi:pimeloyl-ACP methyl ester carboxylesterase